MLQTGLRFLTLALTLLLFLGASLPSHAAEAPIRVGVGQALAPFAIPEAKAGLMVDIFRFNLQGDAAVAGPPAYDEIQYHPVFSKGNQYWFAFHSATLRDQFEAGLAALYSSGKIDLIFGQYQRRYATSREMFISLDCQFLKKNKPAVCKTMAMLEH